MKVKYKIIGNYSKKEDLGSKTISLMELSEINLTPNFFVLTSDFLKDILKVKNEYFNIREANELKKKLINFNLRILKNNLKPLLKDLDKSKKYIIRSSYKYEDSKKYSFAGIFNSCVVEEINKIPGKIIEVYSSLFQEKFLNYYYHSLKKEKIPIAMNIIIQEYIEPLHSGVIFTYKNENKFYVEESPLKGKSVEEGNISPNKIIVANDVIYFVSYKYTRNLDLDTDIEYGWLYLLLNKIKIMPAYKLYDLDIEYLISKNKEIYIVQYRPVTKNIKIDNLYVYFFTIKKENLKDEYIKTIKDEIRKSILSFFNIKISFPFIMEGNVFLKFKDYFKIVEKNIDTINKRNNFHLTLYYNYLRVFFNLKNILQNSELNLNNYFNKLLSFQTTTFSLLQINDKIDGYYGRRLFFHFKVKESDIRPQSYFIKKIKNEKCLPILIPNTNIKDKLIKIKENVILMHDIFDYYYYKLTSLLTKNIKNKDYLLEFYPTPVNNFNQKEYVYGENKKNGLLYGKVFSNYKLPCEGIVKKDFLINSNITKKHILAVETFSPSYVPFFLKAKAIITKEGGLLSHSSIVARELKKPAIGEVEIEKIANYQKVKILKDGRIFLYEN